MRYFVLKLLKFTRIAKNFIFIIWRFLINLNLFAWRNMPLGACRVERWTVCVHKGSLICSRWKALVLPARALPYLRFHPLRAPPAAPLSCRRHTREDDDECLRVRSAGVLPTRCCHPGAPLSGGEGVVPAAAAKAARFPLRPFRQWRCVGRWSRSAGEKITIWW